MPLAKGILAKIETLKGADKSEQLPDDAIWHFQGGVQSNKLKSIVKWSDYIHSLDDLSHAKRISQYAQELDKRQRCFIQVNLDEGQERPGQRSGVKPHQLMSLPLQQQGSWA